MFRDILTESQQALLELLSRIVEVRTFYLAGGTALALHLGHRRSHGIHVDPYHLLRSLTFFEDADGEARPDMLRPIE